MDNLSVHQAQAIRDVIEAVVANKDFALSLGHICRR